MKRFLAFGGIFLIGILCGAWVMQHPRPASAPSSPTEAAKAAPEVASVKGELWLSDFESDDEVKKHWKTRDVVATRAEEHATHGRGAAKLTFGNSEAPSFAMEDYLDSDRRRRDWRGYEILEFDLYNAQAAQERVILQLKDKHGRAYKEDIVLNGKSSQHISLRLSDLKEFLELSYMKQINLFRWKPKKPSTFYVDGLRLRPAGREAKAAQAARAPAIRPTDHWQVAWASSLEKLPRDPAQAAVSTKFPITLSLAGGEYESVQVVLVGGSEAATVRVEVSPIANAEGTVRFPSDVIEIRRVGYVTTAQPYYPVSYVGEWPDPLPPGNEFDIPAQQIQPVWLTIGAPPSLPPGKYAGIITVTEVSGRIEQIPLEIQVRKFVLPVTSHLKTAFDFYRFRLEKAYREFVPGGSAWQGRMGELEDLYFLDMLKHRVMPIMGADPTSSSFGRRIDFYLRVGLGTFGVGTRGGSNGNNWPTSSNELDQIMSWYRLAAQALRSQDLLGQAYVYTYDEPEPGDGHVAQVMEAIHWADPELKNLLVMHDAPDPERHAEWLKHADILCLHIAGYDPVHAERFAKLGKEMWLYVSSPSHPFPALVIDYPAITHRILPWMSWKVGAKGLLYWCVNFWNGDPWSDPANYSKDQNGNGALYYPTAMGPVPSIRMEVLRDGMEDYEYLWLLREALEAAKTRGGLDPAIQQQAEQLLAIDPTLVESLRSYSKDPALLLSTRETVAMMIERLQEAVQ